LRYPSVYSYATRLGSARRKHRFVYCCVIARAFFDVTVLAWRKYATVFLVNIRNENGIRRRGRGGRIRRRGKKKNCHNLNLILLTWAPYFDCPRAPTTVNPALSATEACSSVSYLTEKKPHLYYKNQMVNAT
jgi:hypothetical protein